jgi:FKBP-type peptidyl-prolyl cis-trans isomerase FkpA
MRTSKNFVLFLIASTLLAGCGKVSYRKTAGGMPYQLYQGNGTQKIYPGNIVKVHLSYKVKDSLYFSSFGTVPDYIPVNPTPQPYDISEIWTKLKKGDSLVATQMMDTFIKRNPMGIPPEFKKGDRIITTIKVIDIFTNDSAAGLDRQKVEKEWSVKETDLLGKWLAGKNISAQKTPSGAYVQIMNPGTGNLIDSGKYVSVNYTGTTFTGKKFDSNTDTNFHHVGPYSFIVNAGRMIKGFDEAMRFMKVGSSARVYVPSMLAYGGRPDPQSGIKPYENLIFDITIVDVKDKAPAEKPVETPVPTRKIKVDAPQSHK